MLAPVRLAPDGRTRAGPRRPDPSGEESLPRGAAAAGRTRTLSQDQAGGPAPRASCRAAAGMADAGGMEGKPPAGEKGSPLARAAGAREGTRERAGPLTAARIGNIAEHYIASRECSAAMLRKVLDRRLHRRLQNLDAEARAAEEAEARERIEAEIARRIARGEIDDRRFAEIRIRAERARGHATRRILAGLSQKGIDPEVASDALAAVDRDAMGGPLSEAEAGEVSRCADWEAAEAFARKRSLGRFRKTTEPSDRPGCMRLWRREASAMARAGFDYDIIREILGRDAGEDDEF